VFVGDTCGEEDTPSVGTRAEDKDEDVGVDFSLALPPIAVGGLLEVLLWAMYQPRPIPPAIHVRSRRATIHTQRDIALVLF